MLHQGAARCLGRMGKRDLLLMQCTSGRTFKLSDVSDEELKFLRSYPNNPVFQDLADAVEAVRAGASDEKALNIACRTSRLWREQDGRD